MIYNLNEEHKQAATWLVEQYRNKHIFLEFNIRTAIDRSSFSIWPYNGKDHPEKHFPFPVMSYLTLEILAKERLILVVEDRLNLVENSSNRFNRYSSNPGIFYRCSMLERIFTAVDTSFGEIESKKPTPLDTGGIGLNLSDYYRLLAKEYSLKELNELCLQMNIDHENFPTEKDAKCMELVNYAQRHGRLLELLVITAKARPRTDWSILWS